MHNNIALLHKKVTNCVTELLFMESNALLLLGVLFVTWAVIAYFF